MDERKERYDTVVNRFDKYVQNFEVYCSQNKEEWQALSERNRSNKKKKLSQQSIDESSKRLPEL